MKDSYLSITTLATGEYKEKGSKFIAYAQPIQTEADFALFLEQTRKQHPKARHHCYAWRLGLDQNQFRANDDGEPSGTAGRPILGQIDRHHLTHIAIIVVRYFGGILLGTSGLIRAYRESAANALTQATVVEQVLEDIYEIEFEYEQMPNVMSAMKRLQIQLLQQSFEDKGKLQIKIRRGMIEEISKYTTTSKLLL